MGCKTGIRVHTDLDGQCPTQLTTYAEKENWAGIRTFHQRLHLLGEIIEIYLRLFKLVNLDVHAVEMLVDFCEGPLGHVENCLHTKHLQLEVVTV